MKHSSTCLANRHDRSRDDECSCGAIKQRRKALAQKVYGHDVLQADIDASSTEDLEAGAKIFDRVMAGLCQNCGKKEGCTCNFV